MKTFRSIYLTVPATFFFLSACGKAPSSPLVGGAKQGAVYKDKDLEERDSADSIESEETIVDPVKKPSDDKSSADSGKKPGDAVVAKPPVEPIKKDPIDPNAPVGACATLDFAKVKTIEEITCLGSREKVFQNLPDILKASFTLMQKSRSAQEASLEKPRVIVVSQDGSLLLGAATAADGRQDLEVALYDYEKNKYDFAGIDFTTNPPKIERELCKTCHGEEPRPIWAAYSEWDGAFEPTNDGLTADQATMLNKFAKGETDSPILKALKYKSSYGANKLFNAASGLRETETNEMIGIMMAVKRGQMLSAKLMADAKVTKTELGKIIHDSLCATSTATLGNLGYSAQVHLMTGIVGTDERSYSFRNPNIGFQSLSTFVGHFVLKAAMDKDPDLKSKLNSVQAFYYNNPSWDGLTGKGLGSFLAQAKTARRGYVDFRDLVNGNLNRAFAKGSETCNVIRSYQ